MEYVSETFKNISNGENTSVAKNALNEFIDRDYGVLFELPIEFLVQKLDFQDEARPYYLRHLLVYCIFIAGLYYFFQTLNLIYQNRVFSLLGVIFIALSPRFLGEAFYNSKDIVFMAFYSLAMYGLTQFALRKNLKSLLICAVCAALAVDVRLMGLIFPGLAIFILLYFWLRGEISGGQFINWLLVFISLLVMIVVIFWPWLWANPLEHFLAALSRMSKFPRVVGMNFMGRQVLGNALPWYYIPVWIGVTTPIFYTILFVIGVIRVGRESIGAKLLKLDDLKLCNLVILSLFFAPLIAVIGLNSNLYNSWRHLYFLYIPFIFLAIHGLSWIWSYVELYKFGRYVLVALVSSTLAYQGWWIYMNHPYQYLYFNLAAGKWAQKFDVDYWGVAYPRLIKKIIDQSPGDKYSIFSAPESWNGWQAPYIWNLFLLGQADSQRIVPMPIEDCSNYIIGDYKKTTQYLSNPNFTLFDDLKIDGQIVYSTFKRNTPLSLDEDFYKKSQTVFSDSNNKCFLSQGWGGVESWGVWSTANAAVIRLPLPPASIRTINLELNPFISDKTKSQTVILFVNNSKVASVPLKQRKIISISVPKKAGEEGFLEIRLQIPTAASPKSLGLGGDDRSLGVGLIKLSYL